MPLSNLNELIQNSAYHDYVYAYPHKTAWRTLDHEISLKEAWETEDLSQLFFYIHVPFCEMRCGFCNLFTSVDTRHDVFSKFLNTLNRQMDVYLNALDAFKITNTAIGGGTPSVLEIEQLEDIFNLCKRRWEINIAETFCSIETSPATISDDKCALFKEAGVHRLSIGVQSFEESECKSLKRPQQSHLLLNALKTINKYKYNVFNIDLIYGIPGQTTQSFIESIEQAIHAGANELYLYPLYVRQLTLLGVHNQQPQNRTQLYNAATEYLAKAGWTQKSMRCFQAPNRPSISSEYQCQRDGMIGLGVGARSYTNSLHYSSDYAIKSKNITDIINGWLQSSDKDLSTIRHGFILDESEQKRRYVILSLLGNDLNENKYQNKFSCELTNDFPSLKELETQGLARKNIKDWSLTKDGLALSDTIGHWLFSEKVSSLMDNYVAK